MAILVLGGAGYIGSHTVDRLVNTGSDVVVVDNLSTGHQSAVSEGARFYEGDVRDQEFMETVFNDEAIDAVIHFAAFSIVPESMKTPLKYFDNNVGGLITLLEVMKKHNVDKLIFSSSAATYGEPTRVPIEEPDRQMPTNPYGGESKLMMEKSCGGVIKLMVLSLSLFVTLTLLGGLSRMVVWVKITTQKLI